MPTVGTHDEAEGDERRADGHPAEADSAQGVQQGAKVEAAQDEVKPQRGDGDLEQRHKPLAGWLARGRGGGGGRGVHRGRL
jgi:hypothetical protein